MVDDLADPELLMLVELRKDDWLSYSAAFEWDIREKVFSGTFVVSKCFPFRFSVFENSKFTRSSQIKSFIYLIGLLSFSRQMVSFIKVLFINKNLESFI